MRGRGPQTLRVGFDIDGVLADLDSALSRQAVALYGDPGGDSEDRLTPSRRRRLWTRVQSTDNFWETLEETARGGVSRLAALVSERRWQIVFLTTRPETAGDSAQVQTHRWLAARGFPCPSVLVVRRSRGAIAAALELDVVVDDRSENCLDVISDSDARAILVCGRATEAQHIALNRLRIDVVGGLNESLDLLVEIDDLRREPESRLSGLLRKLTGRLTPAV